MVLYKKVLGRTKTVGQIKKLSNRIKGGKKAKVSKIAARSIEGMAVVGATDFLASEKEEAHLTLNQNLQKV